MKRVVLVAGVLALSACQPAAPPPPVTTAVTTSGPSTFLVDLGDGIQLSLAGTATSTSSRDPRCANSMFQVRTTGGAFQVTLLEPSCAGNETTPGNGNHGFYPAAPATARTDRAATPIGEAVLFSNQYSECTNSCYMGTDEVALVTVGNRVVQVIAVTAPASGTMKRDRTGLVAVLQGLRRA